MSVWLTNRQGDALRQVTRTVRPAVCGAMAVVLSLALAGPALARSPSPSVSATPTVPPGPPVEVSLTDSATPLPQMEAVGWLLADAATGEIMASRGATVPLPPASTLKVLTAYALLPNLKPTSVYIATHKDANAIGSHTGIVAGGSYRVVDLCNGLLLPSGNDAASALAHAYGGWKPALAHMNSEAKRIGARQTLAVNPSGLDADGQVSTPRDLVTIFRAALSVPSFTKTINQRSVSFPGAPAKRGKPREMYKIASQDRLLHGGYPGLIGGKSGYTTNAGRTFVGAANRNGRTLIYSVMNVEIATQDAAKKLLDWGFANIGKVKPVGHLPNAMPRLGPLVPQPAATYSVDGRLLARPGRTAGAAASIQPRRTVPKKVVASADNSSVVALPWLPQALTAFVGVLLLLIIVRAITTFRRKS